MRLSMLGVVCLAAVLAGCTKPPRVSCWGKTVYYAKVRVSDRSKGLRCFRAGLKKDLQLRMSVYAPQGTKIQFGTQHFSLAEKGYRSIRVSFAEFMQRPGFVSSQPGGGLVIPMQLTYPNGKVFVLKGRYSLSFSPSIRALSRVRAGPLLMQGNTSDLTFLLTFEGMPGASIAFEGKVWKIGASGKAETKMRLTDVLQKLSFTSYVTSTYYEDATITRPDGRSRTRRVPISLYKKLHTALKLLKEGRLKAPLFLPEPGRSKRIYIPKARYNKIFPRAKLKYRKKAGALRRPRRYRRRRRRYRRYRSYSRGRKAYFEKLRWGNFVGFADVTYGNAGTFSCRFRRMGRTTFRRKKATYTVYDRKGKVVAKRSFVASRVCPAFVLRRGGSVMGGTTSYPHGWKPWLRALLRKM